MRDEQNFSDPLNFDGRRFLRQILDDGTKRASGISHASDHWMLWGSGTRLLWYVFVNGSEQNFDTNRLKPKSVLCFCHSEAYRSYHGYTI